jgi:hypothetical protein
MEATCRSAPIQQSPANRLELGSQVLPCLALIFGVARIVCRIHVFYGERTFAVASAANASPATARDSATNNRIFRIGFEVEFGVIIPQRTSRGPGLNPRPKPLGVKRVLPAAGPPFNLLSYTYPGRPILKLGQNRITIRRLPLLRNRKCVF